VCILPRVNWMTLARCGPGLLLKGRLPAAATKVFKTASLSLSSHSLTPVEVDGELLGHLPATFAIERNRLRVIAPG